MGSVDGEHWILLKEHKNDDSFKKQDYSSATWVIDNKTTSQFGEAYRYFRLVLTDKTASQHPDWEYVLVITGFELYGFLLSCPQFDEFHKSLAQCKGTELVCAIAHKEPLSKIQELVDAHFLLSKNINDIVTPFGETLVHIASQSNYVECLHWLVTKRNADLSIACDSGQSPYEIAKNQEMKDMIHHLQYSSMHKQMQGMKHTLDSQQQQLNELKTMIMQMCSRTAGGKEEGKDDLDM